jgi:density-regulated protein
MVYCKCGLPPEYCEFGGKSNDFDDCKKWLAENHPDLHDELYAVNEDEESKEDGGKKKKKKSVKFVDPASKKIRVILLKRGGKKINSSILGLELYGINLADCARLLSKKFACGAAATTIDYKEVN